VDVFLEAIGHISELVAILAAIKAAEKAGQGTVNVPPIFIHHHAATWQLSIAGTRTTQHPKPPPLPSPPA
jgi:hypothetical protein